MVIFSTFLQFSKVLFIEVILASLSDVIFILFNPKTFWYMKSIFKSSYTLNVTLCSPSLSNLYFLEGAILTSSTYTSSEDNFSKLSPSKDVS